MDIIGFKPLNPEQQVYMVQVHNTSHKNIFVGLTLHWNILYLPKLLPSKKLHYIGMVSMSPFLHKFVINKNVRAARIKKYMNLVVPHFPISTKKVKGVNFV